MTATLRRRYASSGSFVFEDAVPTAPHFRATVPFLTLPDRVSVEYYCGDEPDVPTQVQGFTADLDPETNRGYVAGSVSLTNRCEAYVTVRSVEPVLRFENGDTAHWERLTSCSRCGSRWAIYRQLAYGDEVDCPDCEHRSYFSIGD